MKGADWKEIGEIEYEVYLRNERGSEEKVKEGKLKIDYKETEEEGKYWIKEHLEKREFMKGEVVVKEKWIRERLIKIKEKFLPIEFLKREGKRLFNRLKAFYYIYWRGEGIWEKEDRTFFGWILWFQTRTVTIVVKIKSEEIRKKTLSDLVILTMRKQKEKGIEKLTDRDIQEIFDELGITYPKIYNK